MPPEILKRCAMPSTLKRGCRIRFHEWGSPHMRFLSNGRNIAFIHAFRRFEIHIFVLDPFGPMSLLVSEEEEEAKGDHAVASDEVKLVEV